MSSLGPDKPNAVVVRGDRAGYRLEATRSGSVAVANEFLEALSIRGLSPATVRAYAFDLVVLYRWLHQEAQLAVEQLSPDDVLRFIAHQQRAGAQPKSINRRLVTCEQLYRFVTGVSMSTPAWAEHLTTQVVAESKRSGSTGASALHVASCASKSLSAWSNR